MGSAKIYLQNNTDSHAVLSLYHYSTNYGSTGITEGDVPPGGKIGPVIVHWNTATPADFWYASVAPSAGSRPGVYVSSVPDDILLPYWKECMLIGEWGLKDDGSSPTFTVDWDNFAINLNSGNCGASMIRTGDYSNIQHVFVLMLENHSYDNMFAALGGIPAGNSNCYNGQTYTVSDTSTPTGMPTDPGHEFADVLEQLGGEGATYMAPNYPQPQMSGFAANYANSTSEKTGTPTADEIGDIMKCLAPAQIPVIAQLANRYALCTNWFSSLPGPTWPNRFYVHGASSAYQDGDGYTGLDDSPSGTQIGKWETVSGFTYRNGSIFDALNANGIPWRIYHDDTLNVAGSIPQVTALKGISLAQPLAVKSITAFASDVASGYPYRYTFIEPNYGDITGNTYKGGSSQHPEDDVAGGENLIAKVVNAIASSPLWPNSMLVITYDEHGGFYDSIPPGDAVQPDPQDSPGVNGFVFNQLGVRVPAVIVSPMVKSGEDPTPYDHSSVPATLERLLGFGALTARDAAANDFLHLFGAEATEVRSAPMLAAGRTPIPVSPSAAAERAALMITPIQEQGNLLGFLHCARKTDEELSAAAALTTITPEELIAPIPAPSVSSPMPLHGEVDSYFRNVMARVQQQRAAHEAVLRARLATPGAKSRDA
jgi:phospholipase C